MLVLGRRTLEQIVLRDRDGSEIARITVVEARRGGKVKIGVDALPEIHVNRAEVDVRIGREGGWRR